MAKITAPNNLSNLKTLDDVIRYMSIFTQDLFDSFNGKVEFDVNLYTRTLDFDFTSANTDVTVSHGLSKVPNGYILVKSNAATSIYDGSKSADNKQITLKASVVATTKVVVF